MAKNTMPKHDSPYGIRRREEGLVRKAQSRPRGGSQWEGIGRSRGVVRRNKLIGKNDSTAKKSQKCLFRSVTCFRLPPVQYCQSILLKSVCCMRKTVVLKPVPCPAKHRLLFVFRQVVDISFEQKTGASYRLAWPSEQRSALPLHHRQPYSFDDIDSDPTFVA
jgi:hypothetical protein